ncbi:MAG: HlyD family efflux transporter periplasmic adaptor subunit [Chloroflexota bacterium]|nr:HlyD family efflux transporter periplasmic adaptor subunit [Chloroflexota bacterium]
MRVLKIVLTLMLCGISVVFLSCASESELEPASENQVVTVQRGDLTTDITASGNLALSLMEDLAFEMSGTVEEVPVEEGESVEQGLVLASLDTSEWETQLKALEQQVTAKERDMLQAEINLENAELALEKAEEQTATYVTGDIVISESADPKEIRIKELQVELAQARLEDTQKALEDAQETLREALDASPEIVAPFDGFITRVNIDGGDEVTKGTVAVQLADPNKFEADILVSEMDILQVKLEGTAYVQVDAMQGMNLPAEVTHISPTATIQSGIVNYKVKVEIESLEAVMQERQQAMPDISSGRIPERLKQAIEEGRITQEQAEEMIGQMQQGQMGQQGQIPAMIPEDFQLREGLTVTVSIIIDERSNVLLVPNAAITTQGRQTYVQVLSPDGTLEERAIQTGISDWQYTEVTDGLSEGEQVVLPQGTTTTSTTQQQRPPGGLPGMGRMLR